MNKNKQKRSRLYTGVGDTGSTRLYDGPRVKKYELVSTALGDVDELSAFVGLLAVKVDDPKIVAFLRSIQSRLLDVGSFIGCTEEKRRPSYDFGSSVKQVEEFIDQYDSACPPLREFILPGLAEADALAHICRTVCRRAERSVAAVNYSSPIRPYINRLSDYFFALARYLSGGKEVTRSQAQK